MNTDINLYGVMNKAIDLLPLTVDELSLLISNPGAVLAVQAHRAEKIKSLNAQKEADWIRSVLSESSVQRYIQLISNAAASQGAPLKAYAQHADWNGEHLAIEFKPQGENVWNVVWEFSGIAPLMDWAKRGISSISLLVSIDDEERLVAELDYNQDDALTFSTPYLLVGIDPTSFVSSGKLIIRENELTQHDE